MPNQSLSAVDLKDIDRSIRDSPPAVEIARIKAATKALDFYKGDFLPYPSRGKDKSKRREYERTAPVLQRVINTLTATLYKDGPKRVLNDPANEAASEWLNGIYRRNNVDALFQQADRYAGIGDISAFQVVPIPDPMRPLKISVWDASQLSVWLDPDDQTEVYAVAARDQYNGQKRLRLWTKETSSTYMTDQWDQSNPTGGVVYKLKSKGANPYGMIPFSFVHWEMPVTDFWGGSPGDHLVGVNECTNFGLTNGFDRVRYNLDPIVLLSGVRAGWKIPPAEPGAVWDLPSTVADDASGMTKAGAEYLQADSSYVVAGWEDLNNYLDMVMEMHGVPPATVRMTQESARSGVSIVAEQIPLITWAKSRQRPFASYEDKLARLVLAMGATHLGAQEDGESQATAAQLEAASADPELSLRWAKMFPDMPGIEQDQSDQWLLDNHLASRTTILMRREGYTREEAEASLEEIAEDLEREQALFAALQPIDPNSKTGQEPNVVTEEHLNKKPDPEDSDDDTASSE